MVGESGQEDRSPENIRHIKPGHNLPVTLLVSLAAQVRLGKLFRCYARINKTERAWKAWQIQTFPRIFLVKLQTSV
ncbi:hypothetical protein AXF42_Ash004569 [Apostasia shenzhenica]|uniref:Uncharacterized protein n=1 Tax=Apostasia shenzhenica TaxID=1088818 RepID=A0A2I0BH04_9ASPA|nr:hypothetical protein AXF42_Ash004569 [Apostasia shenzhenica]